MCAAAALALAGCSPGDDGGSAEPSRTASATVTRSSAPASAVPPAPAPSASAPAPSGTVSPTPGSSAPASASPSQVPVTGPEQKLVTMTVSGGFAGVQQRIVLRGDGTVQTTDRGRTVVRRTSAAQFRKLRTLLGDPALADVPAFTINRGAADLFQYALQYSGRTVVTDRSSDEPALDRLIDALSAWLPGH